MNPEKHLIILKKQIKTQDIKSLYYVKGSGKYSVTFNTGKNYNYGYNNVEWFHDPEEYNTKSRRYFKKAKLPQKE